MSLKSSFPSIRIVIFLFLLFTVPMLSPGQTTPLYPISYRVFNPAVFNPAITGSKDYFSVDILGGKIEKSNSQLINGSSRIPKAGMNYISSQGAPEFTNIGVGAAIFNELNGLARNIGFAGTGSYHVQMDDNALSFLSFGVSAKAIYYDYPGNEDLGDEAKSAFYPNVDLGVYYYSTSLYAGLSATNLLGNPEEPDSLGIYSIPVSRQLFLQVGYKFVISRSLAILAEPSVIVNTDDSFTGDIIDMIQPMLKVYAGNFCIGTYFNDFDKYSFFLQYKYPKFHIGTYFELPRGAPFYKSPLLAEIALGINISAIRSGLPRNNHW